MSDFLFPRPTSRRKLRFRLAIGALVALLVFAGFSAWVGARYLGLVGNGVVVSAKLVTLGDSLGINSNVKFHGLSVGRVVTVSTTPDDHGQYAATVAIDAQYAGSIPSDVIARVLPNTLFGAEYIDLEAPGATSHASAISDGATIAADTSDASVRVMDTFNALYRVLSRIDPSTVNMGISQLAGALRGRGQSLRTDILTVSDLAASYSAAEPTFYSDLAYVSQNLGTVASVEPDLAATLRNSLPLAETITKKRAEIDRVLTDATGLSATIHTFLQANASSLESLLADVAPTYRAFAGGVGPFQAMLAFAPVVLERGFESISNHAVTMLARFALQPSSPYSRADCPRYGSVAGRNC